MRPTRTVTIRRVGGVSADDGHIRVDLRPLILLTVDQHTLLSLPIGRGADLCGAERLELETILRVTPHQNICFLDEVLQSHRAASTKRGVDLAFDATHGGVCVAYPGLFDAVEPLDIERQSIHRIVDEQVPRLNLRNQRRICEHLALPLVDLRRQLFHCLGERGDCDLLSSVAMRRLWFAERVEAHYLLTLIAISATCAYAATSTTGIPI